MVLTMVFLFFFRQINNNVSNVTPHPAATTIAARPIIVYALSQAKLDCQESQGY